MVVKIEQQKNFALKGVEMGMLGLTGGSGNGFLNWKHKDKAFWINSDEIVDFDFMVIDPATIQTGWGIYANGSFDERWDAKAGIQEPKPADIGDQAWKRAFSVKVQLSGWDKPVIWKSHAFGNVMAFDLATDCYLNQAQDDAAKLPCLKNLKLDGGKAAFDETKSGNSSWPKFEFAKWVDRPKELDMDVEDDFPGVDPVATSSVNESDIPF
tara:strand:+ start:65 stop:697 length:633 start_codon:yes stop_codon:yes gene_type:complete